MERRGGGAAGVMTRPVSGAAGEGTTGALARMARTAYWVLAWTLVGCVAYQVFLAGMAVFVSPLNWGRHVFFVHVFELIPVLMLLMGFAGRAPKGRWFYMGPVALNFLIGLQYFFAHSGSSAVAALHTVNALVIFWASAALAQRAGQLRRQDAEG